MGRYTSDLRLNTARPFDLTQEPHLQACEALACPAKRGTPVSRETLALPPVNSMNLFQLFYANPIPP